MVIAVGGASTPQRLALFVANRRRNFQEVERYLLTIFALLAIACSTNPVLGDETEEELLEARKKLEASEKELQDAMKTFQEYGELIVGSWTHTDAKGNVKQHDYRWIANKTLIQIDIVKG